MSYQVWVCGLRWALASVKKRTWNHIHSGGWWVYRSTVGIMFCSILKLTPSLMDLARLRCPRIRWEGSTESKCNRSFWDTRGPFYKCRHGKIRIARTFFGSGSTNISTWVGCFSLSLSAWSDFNPSEPDLGQNKITRTFCFRNLPWNYPPENWILSCECFEPQQSWQGLLLFLCDPFKAFNYTFRSTFHYQNMKQGESKV